MRDTDLFSSIGRPVRDVESFSSFERPLLKGKEIEDWRVCNFLKWKKKEFCLNRNAYMNSLSRQLIRLFFKENLRLREDYLRRRLN